MSLCWKCRTEHLPPQGISCQVRPPRKTSPGEPSAPKQRRRIVQIRPDGRRWRPVYCGDCSVGTRDKPIPAEKKRRAEFTITIGKHGLHNLCRGCAMRFAEDFAAQLEVLIGTECAPAKCRNPEGHNYGECGCYEDG